MLQTQGQKRGAYTRKRRKKFAYLKNTGQLSEYYRQREANKKEIPFEKVAITNLTKKTIMTKKLLWIFPANTLWGRTLRRGIVVAVLTFVSILLRDLIIPSSPEIWIAIFSGILLFLDKYVREMMTSFNEELTKQS